MVRRAPLLIRETCRGQMAFRMWVAARSLGQRELAAVFGVANPSGWAGLSGQSRPDHQFRIAIERIAGIPATSWLTDDEWTLAFGAPRPVVVLPTS